MSLVSPLVFKISVPQDALDNVKQKLALTALPPPAPPSEDSWKYGVPLEDITRILEYWKTQYDWRKHEASLNAELPQFTLPIDVKDHGTFQAHFVHQKAQREAKGKPIPLLFLHGWPGHFAEVRKILPLLTNPESDDDPVFDVVAPSLPGFGFTSAPTKAGFAHAQYAEVSCIAGMISVAI
jgi:pimeloyl-ACP methyl ester carboxylesterase